MKMFRARRRLAGLAGLLVALAACTPPGPEVIDRSLQPQATRDAMVYVPVLPLGMAPPPGVGSVGPVSATGCGPDPSAASVEAVQQLKTRVLMMRGTAVVDVVLGPGNTANCANAHAVLAYGIAVAPRGLMYP